MKNRDAFYSSLRQKLDEQFSWPSNYMFKFIIPTAGTGENQVRELFGPKAKIRTKASSKGKFTSVTIEVLMDTPQKVVDTYLAAEEIDQLIAL